MQSLKSPVHQRVCEHAGKSGLSRVHLGKPPLWSSHVHVGISIYPQCHGFRIQATAWLDFGPLGAFSHPKH